MNYYNGNDEYESPLWILRMFPHFHDPCPIDGKTDGLLDRDDWGVRAYVNPPYSNVLPWVEKAIKVNQKGCFVVMLLKHDSSTEWYRLLHQAGAHFMLPNERLKFSNKKGANFPSMLAVLE